MSDIRFHMPSPHVQVLLWTVICGLKFPVKATILEAKPAASIKFAARDYPDSQGLSFF